MLFNSWVFIVFFLLFAPLFFCVRHSVAKRNALLLISSYIFYGWWDARFLILVAISTSVDYCAALGAAGKEVKLIDRGRSALFLSLTTLISIGFAQRDLWIIPAMSVGTIALFVIMTMIEKLQSPRYRRPLWLCLSLFTNLGILVIFKYFNFFADTMIGLFSVFGMKLDFFTVKIILPVGLSFYTFQAIGRTIDSFKGIFDPQRNLLNYAAYHAFFPQLVAGPIERAAHLMPQFETVRLVTHEMISSGACLFLWGLYKKVVIADNLAPLSNAIFRDGTAGHSAAEILVSVIAFTFVIYCDFSGYSDMARGVGRLIGFDLMLNFNLPYFSRTPSEFWRRWHISLSSWLRDYLYIPLGGNHGGQFFVARNLMITMLLGGLWHGAAWTFVIWGSFHGAIQVIYRWLDIDRRLARISAASWSGVFIQLFAWAVMMVLVMTGWVFFRVPTLESAISVFRGLLGTDGYQFETFRVLLFYVTPLVVIELYQRFSNHLEFMASGPFLARYTATLAVLLSIIALAATTGQQFIYFDF